MITIIAAVSLDGFIGKDGKIPWRLKSDVEHFKNITTGHTVIMGRKTWDSIPPKFRPLPGRKNMIITHQSNLSAEGAKVVHSVKEALRLTENDEQVFIIGGGEIYQQILPLAERLLVTRINKDMGNGDVRFPDINPREWNLVSQTEGIRGENDECDFTVEDYSPNLRYIELANVRTLDQLKNYRRIRKAGHCPFCLENLELYHHDPITWEGFHWLLTKNDFPYPGTDIHYLVIAKKHAETVRELPEEAAQELFALVKKLESEGFSGGAVNIRSGNPILSGASVKHLHAQIVSPRLGLEDRVKFFIGTGKR